MVSQGSLTGILHLKLVGEIPNGQEKCVEDFNFEQLEESVCKLLTLIQEYTEEVKLKRMGESQISCVAKIKLSRNFVGSSEWRLPCDVRQKAKIWTQHVRRIMKGGYPIAATIAARSVAYELEFKKSENSTKQ